MGKLYVCASCGTGHVGMFCHACGTKTQTIRDFSLLEFYKDIFYNVLTLGSKFIDGLWDLCFPGRVTNSFILGNRVEHIRPMQLFGVVNLLFYLMLFNISVFFTRIDDMAAGYQAWPSANNFFHYNISTAIQNLSERYVLPTKAINQAIEANAAAYSKSMLILLVPAWGFLIYFTVRWRDKMYLHSHVLAFNCLSFYMLLGMIYIFTLFYFKQGYVSDMGLLPFHMVFTIYLWTSIKNVFKSTIIETTIYTAISLLAFFLLLSVYRQFTLMLAIWLYKKDAYINIFEYKVPLIIISILIIKHVFTKYIKKTNWKLK